MGRKKKSINEMRIAILLDEDLGIDSIINRHIELVSNPTVSSHLIDIIDGKPIFEENVVREAKPAPRRVILYPKYIYLIHTIIMRCRADKYHFTKLSYTTMIEVLGKHYTDMLRTLEDVGIIGLTTAYGVGKFGRSILLRNWNIGFTITNNKKVIEYAQKVAELIGEHTEEGLKDYGDDEFIRNYQESLSLLQLTKKSGALDYIKRKKYLNDKSKDYYLGKIESFQYDNKMIHSIDANNRIYHYMTNLPRDLKCFFNIKYQCDISNSHPLLFNLFLIDKYNISNDIIDYLLQIDGDIIDNHYLGKQLHKTLKNNNIEFDIKSIPNDVLKYIYSTSKGLFWDGFLDLFEDMERSEIKQKMFCEVFYSKKSKSTRFKPFAKIFKEHYPNVWRVIKELKAEDADKLPNDMMAHESRLFHQILTECYQRNWKVISIHDAIIVLDDESNNHFDLDELIGIMTNVYSSNRLHSTISIDVFD